MEGILQSNKMQGKKIHPHKFALWVAMGSISMMFAGLTSAYMVRESQAHWRTFNLPQMFWYSTIMILLSSITIFLATKAFKNRQIPRYRALLFGTIILGIAFCVMQYLGFYDLYHTVQPVRMDGQTLNEGAQVRLEGNPSESFLFIIAGLHIAHILGGVVALLITFLRSFRTKIKVYNSTGLEIVGGYWHFVDILWIYLFIFFLANQ